MLRPYFGYGANSDPFVMQAITGKNTLEGFPATLRGYELCIQNLNQVPDKPVSGALIPVPPRELLLKTWDESFKTYTVRKSYGDSAVNGWIWLLDERDQAFVDNWALKDFGWYKNMDVRVETLIVRQLVVARTEGLSPDQAIAEVVDGVKYDPILNDRETYLRVARETRVQLARDMGWEGRPARKENYVIPQSIIRR